MGFSVSLVAYRRCWSMNLTTLKDFVHIAAILERKLYQQQFISCRIVSVDGKNVESASGLRLEVDGKLEDLDAPDLIVLPAMEGSAIDEGLDGEPKLLSWLAAQKARGTAILALSTGVEWLGRAGLLEQQVVATHWAFLPLFKKRYPQCRFVSHGSFMESDRLFSTGSLNGGVDVLLHLLASYRGDQFTKQCAAHGLLVSPDYAAPVLPGMRNHLDSVILKMQSWIEELYRENLTIERAAAEFGLSGSSLKRRIKAATGLSFTQYLQAVRVEQAKRLLLSTGDSVQTISYRVGYENQSFFIRLFKARTGMTPRTYRTESESMA